MRRRKYIVVDRHKLNYLKGIEKLNCIYCGYAIGVFGCAREITSRTETYWCPIKHGRRTHDPHARYQRFAGYGDATAYRRRLPALRRLLKK